ncbi:MAG: STT3 domain-containing protein, partial [Candidatus Jordarchaeales archaeon]
MDRRNLLLVLSVSLITLLAFLLRLYPFFMYPPYISDYDSTIQYYNAAFISIYGYSAWFGWYNPMMWYPYGLDMSRSYLPGVPFTAATLFFLLRSIGFNVNIHMVCYFLPAIMGAASCVVLFFLGREVLDDKAGLISSFLLSFLPGAIERTIAGLVDNECVGLFFFLLSLFFFIRSMKRSSIPSAVIAGLALGGFIASWGAAIYLLYVYPLTVILLILMKRYSTNLLMTYSITILIGAFIGTRVPFHGSEYIISSNCILAMLVLLALISWEAYPRIKPTLASISETLAVKAPKLHVFVKNKRNLAVTIFIIVIVIMTGVAVAYSINPIFSLSLSSGIRSFIQISGRYFSVINPFYREEEIIVSSV